MPEEIRFARNESILCLFETLVKGAGDFMLALESERAIRPAFH
jgi:hypothetical protein